MKEQVRRLNSEYGFNLSEEEIELIAKQAEEAHRLFQPLYEVDLTGVAPMMKMDLRRAKAKKMKKVKK